MASLQNFVVLAARVLLSQIFILGAVGHVRELGWHDRVP